MANEVDFSTLSQSLSNKDTLDGSYLKMFQDFSAAKKGKISEPSLASWMNSGMVWRGEYSMRNSLEHPSVVVVYSLSQAINRFAPLKYFLTTAELQSLVKRTQDRQKTLPADLEKAIQNQILTLSKMPLLEEYIHLARKQRDIGVTGKLGLLIPEEGLMLFVRRLMPSEYERFQGFPEGWTTLDTQA